MNTTIRLYSLVFSFLLFLALFIPSKAFAEEAPTLITPANNTTTSSLKLEWQTPSYQLYTGGSPYLVQVNQDSSFSLSSRISLTCYPFLPS